MPITASFKIGVVNLWLTSYKWFAENISSGTIFEFEAIRKKIALSTLFLILKLFQRKCLKFFFNLTAKSQKSPKKIMDYLK